MAKRGDLTPKQSAFVTAYLANGRNAKMAYQAAYSTRGGNAASVEAARLVRHPRIAEVIAEADKEANARLTAVTDQYAIDKERVAQSLAKLAGTDLRDYIEWGPDGVRLRESASLTDAYGLVEVFEQTSATGVRTIRVKIADKRKALMDLARLRGWLDHQVDQQPPAVDEEKRQRAREHVMKMLADLAKPEPLTDQQAEALRRSERPTPR